MTKPTPHGQVPEALIDLIDTYADTRYRYGNARTEAARKAVIEALSGVQALSAAPVVPHMSAAEVNNLPAHVRAYIHQLATLCDPAGLVRENVQLLDTNNALQKMYRRAADACAEVFGCFATAEIEGLKDALSDTTDDRLKDLVERRLMYAMHAVRDIAASPTPPVEQTFITPETGNSASAKGAAITSESGTPPADQQAAQVIINFPQVGTAGPFPVVDGRVSLPDSTMQDLVRMLRPTYEAEQQAQPDECFPGEPKVAVPQGLISAACFAIRNKRDGGKVLEQLRRYSVGDRSQPLAPQQAAPKAAPGMGNSGFDHQTAADFLNGKTISDEAVRNFVATSRWAHDERAALSATLLAMHGVLTSREAEIALLKKALMEAEAAPQQEAQEPVAWLNPWRADQVTADYDAYGERGIPLYAAPQPSPAPLSEMPYEKRKAIQEGAQISASDAWFHARHNMLDTLDRRNVFRAGFDRGWNAALAAQGVKCPVRSEP